MRPTTLLAVTALLAMAALHSPCANAAGAEQEGDVLWMGTVTARYSKITLGTDKWFCTYHQRWGTFTRDNAYYAEATYHVVLRETPVPEQNYSDLDLVSGACSWSVKDKRSDVADGCGGTSFERGSWRDTGSSDETSEMHAAGKIMQGDDGKSTYFLTVGKLHAVVGTETVASYNHWMSGRVRKTTQSRSAEVPGIAVGPPRLARMHPYDPRDEYLDTTVYGPLEIEGNGTVMKGSYYDSVVKSNPTRGGQNVETQAISYNWNLQTVGKEDDVLTLSECDYGWEPKAEDDEVVMFTVNIFQPEYSLVEKIEFRLEDTSKEPGRCLNDYERIDDESFDLSFESERNPFYKISEDGQVATRTDPIFKPYDSIIVTCHDYGARAKLRAIVTFKEIGEVEVPSVEDDGRTYVMIPYDYSGDGPNGIADCMPQDSDGAAAETDQDSEPGGRGIPGDGFAIYEEYRGFLVKGEHKRTDVKKKTLFVASDLTQGIGYATKLPHEVVEINASDFREEDRVMNGCHSGFDPVGGFGHFLDQKALHVEYATIMRPWYGVCYGSEECSAGCCPYHNQGLFVDANKICRRQGEIDSSTATEPVDADCINKTIAHEIGHAIGMWTGARSGQHDQPAADGSTTYMVAGYPWLRDEKIKAPTGYGDKNIAQSDLLCTESGE
jgi:hypothetical protein